MCVCVCCFDTWGVGDNCFVSAYRAQLFVSEMHPQLIDDEVRKLVDGAYSRTKTLLTEKMDAVAKVAELLLTKETISQVDVAQLVGDRPFGIDVCFVAWQSLSVALSPSLTVPTQQPKYKKFVDAGWSEEGTGAAEGEKAEGDDSESQAETGSTDTQAEAGDDSTGSGESEPSDAAEKSESEKEPKA